MASFYILLQLYFYCLNGLMYSKSITFKDKQLHIFQSVIRAKQDRDDESRPASPSELIAAER